MLKSAIVRIVDFCTRYPWWVLALALILSAASAVYAARHFAIKTDINELISKQLSWTQRATEYMAAFPQREILAVVDAPTPELVEQAATKLAESLQGRPDVIRAVRQPQSGSFFERNGLLFLSTEEVARVTDGLTRADALLETLAADPSLRGTLDALSFGVMGVERKELKLDDMTRPMTLAADTVDDVLAGRPASFSWRVLASGKPAEPRDLRRFIEVEPVLDFSALQPGHAATSAIAQTAADLHLAQDYRARVRQTGLIPIDDDEFGTLKQNAGLNATASLLAVLLILWLALRSFRIIFAVAVSITLGLAVSVAWGLFLVGAFNLISVAFFVLFVGLGIDFGIQFSVRYRAERHDYEDLPTALHSAAVKAGGPLALAAAATAVDFNPLHLRSPKVESVATFLELRRDPETGANSVEILAPNLAAANATAQRIASLPQVSRARTLQNLVPTDQEEKLKLIRRAASAIDALLNPKEIDPSPTDQENVEALSSTADSLTKVAGNQQGPGADAARRLSGLLSRLAKSDPAARKRAETAVVAPLRISLHQLRQELKPERITVENIPRDLAREWVTPDGHARVQVLPKGDPDNTEVLRDFVTAVLAVQPDATGPAVSLFEAGNTVVRAFVQAGIFALSAIAVLLWITLRRITDVLLTLVPLLVAGVVTLELCVLIELPLNFADIIALPLLLGVGVAFKIYYIMAWRQGKTALLQSSLTRAVIFSALTTATAFGSLWLSSHPGTSSMGKLMALALVCTMAAAVLFQPALMGPPRVKEET